MEGERGRGGERKRGEVEKDREGEVEREITVGLNFMAYLLIIRSGGFAEEPRQSSG